MSGIGLFAGMAVLAAVFPTGALPAGGIGRVTRAALGLIGVVAMLQAVDPAFATTLADGSVVDIHNPIGIAPGWSGWDLFDDGQVYVFALLGIVICVVGLVIRFRRSSGIERQQDRWLLASLALVAVAVFIGFIGMYLFGPETGWSGSPRCSRFHCPRSRSNRDHAVPPLRDRSARQSHDFVRRCSATLLAVYAGMLILVLQGPLGTLTGGDTVAVAASTLVAAALFQPVRRRIQGTVDHRFNRAGYDAEQTVAGLASRLRDQMDLPVVSGAVVDAVVASVEPTGASLSAATRADPIERAATAEVGTRHPRRNRLGGRGSAGAVALVVAVSRFQYLDEFDYRLVYAGLAVAVITDATVGALLTLDIPGTSSAPS